MTRRGRPAAELVLTDDELEILRGWSADDTARPDMRLRALIVLSSAEGTSNVEVSLQLGVHRMTVAKWRTRFVERRLNGLRDEPRPGRPRALNRDDVAEIVGATIGVRPPAGRWSRDAMARRSGLSKSTVGRIWREHGLAPHEVRSSDCPVLRETERIVDIAGMYLSPPERAIAFCADAGPPGRGVDWNSTLAGPRRPGDETLPFGIVARRTVTAIIGALSAGGTGHRRPHTPAFASFLSTLDERVPAGFNVRVTCGGFADPLGAPIRSWLSEHPRIHVDVVVSPPTWTSYVGQWLLRLADRTLGEAAAESVVSLEAAVTSWFATGEPLLWVRSANELRV
jgi:hypothetical protein